MSLLYNLILLEVSPQRCLENKIKRTAILSYEVKVRDVKKASFCRAVECWLIN
jgi:hypothetical protein